MIQNDFVFQLFDTHNTCVEQVIPLARTLNMARECAKRLSLKYKKVILNKNDAFEQYENGEKTEWSFPAGIN